MATAYNDRYSDYLEMLAHAERAALHSIYDQHVVELPRGGYAHLNEEHLACLAPHQIDAIVYTAPGALLNLD